MWALLRPPFKALGIGQHMTRTLAVSFVTLVQTGTTPDSERRPEALGRVYNTRTFVHVHCGMDQVGGEKLEEIVGYPDFPVTEGNSEPLRCIVTWKQLMFGFMSGVNITDITTQLKQTELGTSNLMECYLHNPVCFLEAVQPDLFKYKKWVVWVGLREYVSAIGSWIKPSRGLII
ncbi:unnamed protein product [Brassica oleracea var. botrytis]